MCSAEKQWRQPVKRKKKTSLLYNIFSHKVLGRRFIDSAPVNPSGCQKRGEIWSLLIAYYKTGVDSSIIHLVNSYEAAIFFFIREFISEALRRMWTTTTILQLQLHPGGCSPLLVLWTRYRAAASALFSILPVGSLAPSHILILIDFDMVYEIKLTEWNKAVFLFFPLLLSSLVFSMYSSNYE